MSAEEKEADQPQPFDLTALELEQILGLLIGMLASKAWQYMGLQLTPGKKETEKDLAKAAATIDCISFLAEKLFAYLPEAEASSLRSMIADLKINYVKNS